MTSEYTDTDEFRGARFTSLDFSGVVIRDCDVRNLKIVDSHLVGVNISGFIGSFLVNDVDVTAFVEAELARQHPERAQVREVKTADDHRAMWTTIEGLWSQALARARQLPEGARQERVDEEWSFVETMRHLLFATDAWVGSSVLDAANPYHPLGMPSNGYTAANALAIGLTLDAKPSFDEVLTARADRMAMMRRVVDELSAAELDRVTTRPPAPGYPDKPHTIGQCVRVVLSEEVEHYRYAVRDLSVLESRS